MRRIAVDPCGAFFKRVALDHSIAAPGRFHDAGGERPQGSGPWLEISNLIDKKLPLGLKSHF